MAEENTASMTVIHDDDDDRASKFLLNVSITYLTLQRHIPEGACGLSQCCENLDLIIASGKSCCLFQLLREALKRFKSALRTYLTEHAFYSLDKYYQLTS